MAPVLPTCEPVNVVAGDTWAWTHQSAIYLVSEGWALSYSIRGKSSLVWDPSYVANDGSIWTVTIPATITAALAAGSYVVERHYTLSGNRYTNKLPRRLVVIVDAATAAASATFAEQMLAASEAAYLARVGQPLAYTIHQRQAQKEEIAKYRAEWIHWKNAVIQERNGGRYPPIKTAFNGHS